MLNAFNNPVSSGMVHEQTGQVIYIVGKDSYRLVLLKFEFLDTLNLSVFIFFILRHYFRGHSREPYLDHKKASEKNAFQSQYYLPQGGVVAIVIYNQVDLNFS